MHKYLLVLAVVAACAAAFAVDQRRAFDEFKAKYQRTYASAAEEAKRLAIFRENMEKAAQLSKENPQASFGANEFADMSAAEFKVRHNAEKFYAAKGARQQPVEALYSAAQVQAAAKKIDWRAKGAVTKVKNQASCGSCWAFSATGNIEGQWFLAGHKLVSLSEQELVSCDTTDHGCQGGLMDNGWEWLVSKEQGNIATEASYPYVSGSGNVPACALPKTTGATISGHKDLPKNESQLATWMYTHGPISLGVYAQPWQSYTGGVMTNCAASQPDHGVLAVGYDLEASTPYWIVKNSWGPTWGEKGYIRLQFGTNQCNLEYGPCTSIVSGGPTPPTPPSPPSPPTPPTPPTPPSGANFTQYICQDSQCSQGCSGHTFPQNQCLPLNGGGSAIAVCVPAGLELTVYMTSSDCTGSSQKQMQPVNQCVPDSAGTYLKNVCSSSEATVAAATRMLHSMLQKK